eukprot:scaffold47659_cov60-Phaeocystis_antarctica.AAC.1
MAKAVPLRHGSVYTGSFGRGLATTTNKSRLLQPSSGQITGPGGAWQSLDVHVPTRDPRER